MKVLFFHPLKNFNVCADSNAIYVCTYVMQIITGGHKCGLLSASLPGQTPYRQEWIIQHSPRSVKACVQFTNEEYSHGQTTRI